MKFWPLDKKLPIALAVLLAALLAWRFIFFPRPQVSFRLLRKIRAWASRKNKKHEWLNYQPVSHEEAERLKELTGLSLAGYWHRIDSDAARHALLHKKDPLPVTKQDLAALPWYIHNAQSVELTKRRKSGSLPILKYSYTATDGVTTIIEEIRTGWRRLAFVTMYKRKRR